MKLHSKFIISASAIACSAFLFAGCSDSTSANDVIENQPMIEEIPTPEQPQGILVEEQPADTTPLITKDSIEEPNEVEPPLDEKYLCENDAYANTIVDPEGKTFTYNDRTADYSFKGDTLIIRWRDMRPAMDCGPNCYGTADGIMLVGGIEGKLEGGSWEMIPYIQENSFGASGTITHVNNMRTATYTFTEMCENVYHLATTEQESFDMEKSDDLMNSTFMAILYKNIYRAKNKDEILYFDGYFPSYADYLLYDNKKDVENNISKYDVEVLEKTNTSETFSMYGKTFTVTVDFANAFPLGDKYKFGKSIVNEKTSFTIKSGEVSCSYKYNYNPKDNDPARNEANDTYADCFENLVNFD